MKEIFDNYDNPDGYADILYLSALRDSHRIVRKAEEEINRQQVEIERLQKETNLVSIQFQDLQERINDIKSEAIKEFANKLKKHSRKMQSSDFSGDFWYEAVDFSGYIWDEAVLVEDIDDLVKEMVGEE